MSTPPPSVAPPGLYSHQDSSTFLQDNDDDDKVEEHSEESWNQVEVEDCGDLQQRGKGGEGLVGASVKTIQPDFPDRVVATEEESAEEDFVVSSSAAASSSPASSLKVDGEAVEKLATTISPSTKVEPSPNYENEEPSSPVSSPPPAQLQLATTRATSGPREGEQSPARLSYTPRPLLLALPPAPPPDSRGTTAAPTDLDPHHGEGGGFAHVIRERTRQRRAREDAAVATLKVQVSRLEAALAAESRRRVAAIAHVHECANQAASELADRLQWQHREDVTRVHDRLQRLEERMAALEARWSDSAGALQDEIHHQSRHLKLQLQSIQQAAANEIQQKQIREQRLQQQMLEVAAVYEERWQQERQDRMAAVSVLLENMDSVHSSRNMEAVTLEGRLQQELQQLQRDVETEMLERHASDEEIVSALNRYTKQLQDSLAAAVTGGSTYY